MADILNFADARKAKEDKPDDEFVCVTCENGKAVHSYKFTCSFDHDGCKFGFHIWAADFDDAQRRISAIKETAVVDGQLYRTIAY